MFVNVFSSLNACKCTVPLSSSHITAVQGELPLLLQPTLPTLILLPPP